MRLRLGFGDVMDSGTADDKEAVKVCVPSQCRISDLYRKHMSDNKGYLAFSLYTVSHG